MIQRIQSLYLLGSIVVCGMMYFLPLGQIASDVTMRYTVCGLFNETNGELIRFNFILSSILSITVLLQLVSIFLFKHRNRQAMMVQISLITLLLFVVASLLFQDVFSIKIDGVIIQEKITFNYNIILLGIAWILTYLALKAIKKDEALVRSVNRMR